MEEDVEGKEEEEEKVKKNADNEEKEEGDEEEEEKVKGNADDEDKEENGGSVSEDEPSEEQTSSEDLNDKVTASVEKTKPPKRNEIFLPFVHKHSLKETFKPTRHKRDFSRKVLEGYNL